ncbi:MAG: NlpC/P60 family protein [Desulfovibrio sp.]|nr:MAG: NlpC/P60 family protein [Desulfovibrio sp.]
MGTRYCYGGTSASGFDCSGFVQTVYKKLDYDLPHSSRDQARLGAPVAQADLMPGDLVFFDIRHAGVISHVGIYIGNGDILHASVHTGVTIDNLSEDYYRSRYHTARRILRPEDQFLASSSGS